MFSPDIPPAILAILSHLEPGAHFYLSGASKVQSSSNRSYFVKQGSKSDIEQYTGEVESLRAMYAACPGICPRVLEFSVNEASQRPLFISEYKDICPLNKHSAAALGSALADMHSNGQSPTGKFGFGVPTFCGATRMRNGWEDTWAAAYNKMLGDLVDKLKDAGGYEELCSLGDQIRSRVIPQILGSLCIDPALLHGDLWSGNAGTESQTSRPIIYDPSSYYGHNEADLSIARIFGGFPPAFFQAYHSKIPPSEPTSEYEHRCALYELFHYLNHTILFGRSYESSARQKMTMLLRYVDDDKTMSIL
ncbi:fructosamine kinase [Hysterangium stoloniferum]|nr:fructosamine kinase [Hysterangium stoloniferum]